MIVDIHTHIFPEPVAKRALDKLSAAGGTMPFTDGTSEGLRKSMDEAEAELSIVLTVATSSHQVTGINDFAARLNDRYKGQGIISFAAMHPDFTNYRHELDQLKSMGFLGIKVHPAYQETDLDDIRYLRIFERAAEVGLTVLTHAGLDIGFPGVVRCSTVMARHVADIIGKFPFILAHMGGWGNWQDVIGQLADTEVYIDTSFSIGSRASLDSPEERIPLMEDGLAMDIIKAFGAERVMFGSDSPWSSQKESVEAVRRLPLSEEERALILGGNAQSLLGIQDK